MVILSYEFSLVFLLFFCVYWLCRRSIKVQNYLLIFAGLLFVASWNWKFVFSLLFMWQATQIFAMVIDIFDNRKVKLLGFLTGMSLLLGHLVFFKYSNFFIEEINNSEFFATSIVPLDIIMPLGVSFYTFQAISYLVDVYQEKIKPMPSDLVLAVLAFVPTLTSGPIFRVNNAIHQWSTEYQPATDAKSEAPETQIQTIDPETKTRYIIQPYLAATLISFALAKKLLLAGWLEEIWVNPVFANPLQFNGLEVLTAVYAYALQLFFDFSGYTDLAIALALLLGFRIPENFRQPYLATDIQDFWSRWHITLSHWIRDYLYIPLGGNRCSFWRVQFNVMVAFVLSGIWHGAGWNFFIWGAIHGVALVWLNLMKKTGHRHRLTQYSQRLANFVTFNYVCFGWIFFHSSTFDQSMDMIKGLFNYAGHRFTLPVFVTLFFIGIGWLVYPKLANSREWVSQQLQKLPWWALPIVISVYVVFVCAFSPDGLPGFIYSNF